jgi:excisionase family DNA binding protein
LVTKQTRTSRRFISIPDAAELLGCHPKTLRRRVSDGTLPAYKMGHLYRLDLDEVEAAFRRIPTVDGVA